MGTASVAKSIVSIVHKVRQDVTTNPRALRGWGRRMVRIADAPDVSNTEKKEVLKSGQQFHSTLTNRSGSQPDKGSKTPLISPELQEQRSQDIFQECEKLNRFQDAAESPEVLKKAISEDKEDFIIQWEGLARGLQRDATYSKQVSLALHDNTMKVGAEPPKLATPELVMPDPVEQIRILVRATSFYVFLIHNSLFGLMTQLQKACLNTNAHLILVKITDMGLEKAEYAIRVQPKNTFKHLLYSQLHSTSSKAMTDFWCKRRDPKRNCVTDSGIWWEKQEHARRICEVVMGTGVDESLGIESVTKSGDYVVVLVEEDRMERGVPVGLPEDISQSAKDHFMKKVFPNHELLRIVKLHDNEDASYLPFNKTELPLTQSTLYVEVNARLKGKGKARQVGEL